MIEEGMIEEAWLSYKSGLHPELQQELVHHYLPLVHVLASRFGSSLPAHVDKDDLLVAGSLGLIDAVEKYDPLTGNKFETYASLRVRGAMLDELRAMDWLPRSTRQKAQQIQETYKHLEREFKRVPSAQEVADHLDMGIQKLNQAMAMMSGTVLLSLDATVSQESDNPKTLLDSLMDSDQKNSPSYALEETDKMKVLDQAIQQLGEKEQTVLALYYYERLMLREIGEALGISESRVCQIHSQAISSLKTKLARYMEELV